MAVTIIYLIMNTIRTYAIYNFIDNFLKEKHFSSRMLFGGYGIYYAFSSFFYLDPSLNNAFYNIVLNLSFAFLIGCFFYDATYKKRILCAAFICILSVASEDCTIIILTLLFKTSFSTVLSNTHLIIMGLIISMMLLLIIVKLVNPLFKRQTTELNRLYWFAVFAIPSGCIYILHSLVSQLKQGERNALFVLITILLLFAFNILVFYLYNNLLTARNTQYENILLIQQNKAYENQALLIRDFQADLKNQRHDLQNQLSIVRRLTEQQEYEKLLIYLNDWSSDIITIESGIHTNCKFRSNGTLIPKLAV